MSSKRRPTVNTERLEEELSKKESDESNMSNRSQPKKDNRKRVKLDPQLPKNSTNTLAA